MRIGVAIIISLLAVVALVAEVVLYFVLGMGAAFAGAQTAVGGLAFIFVGLMIVTATAAVLAPIGAVVELATKKANLGAWILVGGLAIVATGYIGVTALGYVMGNRTLPSSATSVASDPAIGTLGPSASSSATTVPAPLLEAKLLKKSLTKQDYQDFVFFDVQWHATGLKKPARAIKGVLQFQDLFGESKLRLNWTIDKPLTPGEIYVEKNTGFRYNMFMSDHQWVNSTEIANMKVAFTATNVIYQDGSTEEIKQP